MGNDEFLKIATEEVRRYTNEHLEDPQDFDIYVMCGCVRHFKITRLYYKLRFQMGCTLSVHTTEIEKKCI